MLLRELGCYAHPAVASQVQPQCRPCSPCSIRLTARPGVLRLLLGAGAAPPTARSAPRMSCMSRERCLSSGTMYGWRAVHHQSVPAACPVVCCSSGGAAPGGPRSAAQPAAWRLGALQPAAELWNTPPCVVSAAPPRAQRDARPVRAVMQPADIGVRPGAGSCTRCACATRWT